MKADKGNKILEAGVLAAEHITSVSPSGALYDSFCMYLFDALRYYITELKLYMLDENKILLEEQVVCNDGGIIQGEDLIPLYQLPAEVDKINKVIEIQEEESYFLYIPLAFKDKLLGMFILRSNYSLEAEITQFENMAKFIALGFYQLLSSRNHHSYKAFFNKTIDIENNLHKAKSVEQLVITFARQAVMHLNFDRATVFIFGNEQKNSCFSYCVTTWGKEVANVSFEALPGNILTPLSVYGNSGYWFPLYTNARQVGLVLFDNLYSQYPIPENYLDMLTPLCNQFAATVDNARLIQDVQRAAQRDSLTGLYNRSYFEAMLEHLDTDENYPLALILGDVNGLKITNDIFGHFEGDVILQSIAEILKSVCRKDDVVARWGGDEFVILLPKTSEKRANAIVQAVRQRCKSVCNSKIQLSISMGSAAKKISSEEMMSIMKRAEEVMYRNKLLERTDFRNTFIATMREMLHENCQETEEHIDRMDHLSGLVGKFMRLSDNDREELKLLAMLHDIGKVAISKEILNKPGKLTKDEWIEVRKHSETGYRIAQASPELSRIASFILFHHERWDGKGYPMGKKGLEIPLLSRIISVIDAYDVMTHGRIYQKPITHDQALIQLKRCAGTQFDPDIVANFIELQEALSFSKQ